MARYRAQNVVGAIGEKGGNDVRVFISSVIAGFETFRDAVEEGVRALGHEVVRAETFAAQDASSRVACLSGVRSVDMVVLLLGERYGTPLPPLNVSPTHEEFLEAKGSKPMLVFVQVGVTREAAQEDFVRLVEDWDEGRHRRSFREPNELRSEVTRAIHELELSAARTPVDVEELKRRAIALVSPERIQWGRMHQAQFRIGFSGGPDLQVLRPRELEREDLESTIAQMLLFGDCSIFGRERGFEVSRSGGTMTLSQDSGNSFSISEQGDISIALGSVTENRGIPCIIVEDVEEKIERGIKLAAKALDLVDSANRLSRFVIALRANGAEYFPWRTRAEHIASPNTVTHSFFGSNDPPAVMLSPPDVARAALCYEAKTMAEDLAALLQREASGEYRN